MFIRLNIKEIASLVTDTLIHVGPGLFLLQEILSVICGDSCLSITGSKEDMGIWDMTDHAWDSVVDISSMQKTFDVFFKLSFSEACFKSVCSSWHSFIRVTSAMPDCMWCMPWRSFPFWGENYGWCNQSAWSLLGLTASNGPHWVLQRI